MQNTHVLVVVYIKMKKNDKGPCKTHVDNRGGGVTKMST